MPSIGASGFLGVAPEVTPGTYVAPTFFFPIRSESLQFNMNNNERRVIRGTADVLGAVAGDGGVEGTIEAELLGVPLVHLLKGARGTLTESSAVSPYVYEFVPTHVATPANTLSITVVRGGVAFGYTKCVIGGVTLGVDNSQAVVTFNVTGSNEEDVAVPTPSYASYDPFGAGDWVIEIPTTSQVYDCDNLSLEINDNPALQNRLKDTLGSQFTAFGERSVTMSVDRDFENKTEYGTYKSLTSQAIKVLVSNGATDQVQFDVPVAITNEYSVGLGGVGDLVRGSISYMGVHDAATGGAYKITVTTGTQVTL